MTDIFEEYASDKYKEFLEADGGAARGYSTFDGRMLGLPVTGAQPDNVPVFVIRQDWLDKIGKEVPTTIEELIEVARTFKEAELGGKGTYGLLLRKNQFWTQHCMQPWKR